MRLILKQEYTSKVELFLKQSAGLLLTEGMGVTTGNTVPSQLPGGEALKAESALLFSAGQQQQALGEPRASAWATSIWMRVGWSKGISQRITCWHLCAKF